MNDQEIKISAQPLLDPDVCIFQVNRQLNAGGSIDCKSKEQASGSPLLEALFSIGGIREVVVNGDSLTVAKTTSENWQELGKKIGETIRAQIISGKPLISANQNVPSMTDEQIHQAIEDLFATEINPAIGAHGGHVELVDVKDAAIFLRLGGGCQGCGAASMTLKHGIERAIRDRIPAVTEIVDVTDHTAGNHPFY